MKTFNIEETMHVTVFWLGRCIESGELPTIKRIAKYANIEERGIRLAAIELCRINPEKFEVDDIESPSILKFKPI